MLPDTMRVRSLLDIEAMSSSSISIGLDTAVMEKVKWLRMITPSDEIHVGAKAANLGRLRRGGWLTPDGFCITTSAYRRFVQHNGLNEFLDVSKIIAGDERDFAEICAQAQASVQSAVMPEDIVAAIEQAHRQLILGCGRADAAVAVRSSATVEDLSWGSFAGLFDTILNVSGDNLLQGIKKCWASLWNTAALTWLKKCNARIPDYTMAVVIQKMVNAESAGVMFTANPVSGNRFEIAINSTTGIGEGVVSGNAAGDRFVVRESDLAIVESEIARDTPAPSLSEAQVILLAKLGLQLQKQFGRPQDVEWAITAGTVYILQSRPIVKLPSYFPVQRENLQSYRFTKWQLEFPEVFSEFGRSLEDLKNPIYNRARSKIMGVEYSNYRTIFNGYIYNHPVISRPFWLPMALLKVWQYCRLLILARNADRRFQNDLIPSFLAQGAKIQNSISTSRSLEEVLDAVKAAVASYLFLEGQTVLVNVLAMSFSSLVFKLTGHLSQSRNPLEAAHLLSGVPNKTTERDAKFAQVVRLFHANRLSCLLDDASSWQEVVDRLKDSDSGREFLTEFGRFSGEFGYVWADGNVKDPGWRQDDDLVILMFRKGTRGGPWQGERPPRPYAGSAPPSSAIGRIVLHRVVQNARRYSPYREDHNHYLSKAVMVIREALLVCGRELVQLGIVSESEDIFHLTYEEVLELPERVRCGTFDELKNIINERALEIERQKRLTPPSVLELDREESSGLVPVSGSILLFGTPGSRGIVSGPARVLNRGDLERIREGDILVCHNFRPDWSPLLRYIRGLVTNNGYNLTHGATLAREWGIPAVVGVREATQIIRDGDILQIDGDKGTVRVEAAG